MDEQPNRPFRYGNDDDETPLVSHTANCENVSPMDKLEKLLKEGYEPARKYLEICKKFYSLIDMVSTSSDMSLKRNHELQLSIVHDLTPLVQTDSSLPHWPVEEMYTVQMIISTVAKRHKLSTALPSELDKSIHICQLYFACLDSPKVTLALAIDYSEKYPMELYFHRVRSTMLGKFGRIEEGLQVTNKALEISPTDDVLLFNKAVFLKNYEGSSIEEQLNGWEAFLQQSSKIDRRVAESYYEIALIIATYIIPEAQSCKVFTRAFNTMKKAMKDGEDAESYILPNDLPEEKYFNRQKVMVKIAIAQTESLRFTLKIEDQKSREIVLKHRSLCCLVEDFKSKQIVPKSLKIYISDTKSDIPSSRSLKLTKYTSIEPAVITSVNSGRYINLSLVLQQNYYEEIIQCKVLNFDITNFDEGFQNRDIQELFGIGCKISIPTASAEEGPILIINPCPDFLIFHLEERLNRPCYYCGMEDATMKCVKCKVANYCDRHCQGRDWKVFDHQKFCTTINNGQE